MNMRAQLYPICGALALVAIWEIVGAYRLVGPVWPSFTEVLAALAEPARRSLYIRATQATLASAALGYGIGAVLGVALAVVSRLLPALRRGADRLNAWIHAIPLIALGPFVLLLLGVEAAAPTLAAVSVMFVVYVAVTSGFDATTPAQSDLMSVLGANAMTRLRLVSFPAAVPAIVTGLKLAAPRAAVGAILGEWLGAPRGLGVLMLTGMQEFRIPLLWSAVLLATLLSLIVFWIGSVAERLAERRFR
jgi:NitT/TauT family transport system permease protein